MLPMWPSGALRNSVPFSGTRVLLGLQLILEHKPIDLLERLLVLEARVAVLEAMNL